MSHYCTGAWAFPFTNDTGGTDITNFPVRRFPAHALASRTEKTTQILTLKSAIGGKTIGKSFLAHGRSNHTELSLCFLGNIVK